MTRLTDETVTRAWDDAYAYQAFTDRPREVVIPARYWLAAIPGLALCVLLLVVIPNPLVMS